jgi:TonB family protein
MSSTSVEPRPWPQRRWWIFVALVFGVQLGLIFWLSDKSAARPRAPGSVPSLRLAGNAAADLLALSDPTLFALPHRQGFSGLAWLRIWQPEPRFFDWSEGPRWLELSVQRLGAAFDRSSETADFNPPASPARPEPELTIAEVDPLPSAPAHSRLRLEGGLVGRRLITPIELQPEPHTDLLTDSVVQIVVNSAGRLTSVPVLLSRSGSKDADDHALRIARTARFDAIISEGPGKVTNPMADLTWGRMIFEWHTVPVPPTNSPSTGP